jgi:hypothetical protein
VFNAADANGTYELLLSDGFDWAIAMQVACEIPQSHPRRDPAL